MAEDLDKKEEQEEIPTDDTMTANTTGDSNDTDVSHRQRHFLHEKWNPRSRDISVKIGIAVVACAIGLGIGHFAVPSSIDIQATNAVEMSENDVDKVNIASYTFDGNTYSVTAKDVYESNGTLETSKNDDGTYSVPASTDVLAYIRSEVVKKQAEKEGLTATDEEMDTYAKETLQTDETPDYDTLAQQYGMDVDTLKQQIRDAATMDKLRTNHAGDSSDLTAPTAPTAPSDGSDDASSKEYADYIINLAGDQWDADANDGKGGWKDENSSYAQACSNTTVTNSSATYQAAQAVYYVAYADYQSKTSSQDDAWTDYLNGIFDKVTIELGNANV